MECSLYMPEAPSGSPNLLGLARLHDIRQASEVDRIGGNVPDCLATPALVTQTLITCYLTISAIQIRRTGTKMKMGTAQTHDCFPFTGV